MTKTLTIIAFIILLAIGGLIVFPRKNTPPEVLTPNGDTSPSRAVMQGPNTPPAPSAK
jgi:uncharacterized membrane protein